MLSDSELGQDPLADAELCHAYNAAGGLTDAESHPDCELAESGEPERGLTDSDDAGGDLVYRNYAGREPTDSNHTNCAAADGHESLGDSVGTARQLFHQPRR
jgi:hypothetical protein